MVARALEPDGDPQSVQGAHDAAESTVPELETDEYEVVRILEHFESEGETYYLVAWVGFPDGEATWLTAEELGSPDVQKTCQGLQLRVAKTAPSTHWLQTSAIDIHVCRQWDEIC
jgi:hypothetical protein